MKKILFTLIFVLTLCKGYTQENGLAFSFSYDNYFGENVGTGNLLGFRISYEQMKEQFGRSGSWRSGLQFSFGAYTKKYIATKKSTYIPNSLADYIEVTGNCNYKSVQFEYTQKMYFGNGNLLYGGFYFLMGIGFNVVQRETTYIYDKQNYDLLNQNSKSKSTYQFTVNTGAGYEFLIGDINLFLESDINIPFVSISSLDIEEFNFNNRGNNFYGASMGIRFHF